MFGRHDGRHGRCHSHEGSGSMFGMGWGRRHRGGRLFAQGDLRFVILSLIAERPRHGYELIKALEERSGGLYVPSPGAIYPILTLLEDQGHARASTEESGRKRYEITEEGRKALAENRDAVEAMFARLDMAARAGRAAAEPVELMQAMQLLKQALAVRHGRAPWSDAEIAKIRAILERATTEVLQA